MSAGPVNTLEITVQRKFVAGWPIVLEYSRADALSPIRSDGVLKFGDEFVEELKSLLGQPREYGVRLGKALFQDLVRDAFVNARGQSEDRLRVLLCIEADDLRDLRWERLAAPIDGGGWDMLALNQRTPFCLYMPSNTDRRFPPIGRRDLRALLLVASPEDSVRYHLTPFDVPETVAGVRSALGDIPCDVLANIDGALGPPSLDGLCARLTDRSGRYTMLHVVCHGKVIEGGETVVYWAHADNRTESVTATALLECLGRFGGLPYFAFLAACESASAEAEAALGGLAQRMVRGLGMPAVLAMTDRVTMQTGAALATAYYRQLGVSGEVDTALPEATAALARRGDVLVPALFSRLSRPLFSDLLDRELTNEEIKFGLDRLSALLVERAPVLQEEFEGQAAIVVQTLGADATALSKDAREEREQALGEINRLCEKEALDLSFNALALGRQPPQYDVRCPFRGLYPFRLEDREFFFGREALIEKLRQKLAENNFLPVLGSSGSGKTSVVLAGLVPALQDREKGLQLEDLTPGSEPLECLEAALAKLSDQPGVRPGVLVMDQFEELFTLCADQAKRVAFIDRLLSLASSRRVVLTMRADFWGDCAPYKEFRERMEARQSLIPPMEAAELRKSMEQQAGEVGLRFQDGLSNRILDDVQGEPGAMPLLQHALFELWKRRHGRWLCWSEYEAIGGVQQAIAGTADRVYDRLSPAERPQVQNIFERLTRVDATTAGEMRRDTRRRVWLEELVPAGGDPAVIEGLVQQLAGAEARLVVTGLDEATQRETVEVAHEALIQHWPRLQRWLDEDRANLMRRQSIHEAAEHWVDHAKEDSYLVHRGGRLEDAEALLHRPEFLNKREADYVRACADLRERERAAADRRRRKITIASLAAAAVMAVLLVAATWSWIEADRQRQRVTAQSLAAQSALLVERGRGADAIERAAALAIESWHWMQNSQATEAASDLVKMLPKVTIKGEEKDEFAFTSDGKFFATGSEEGVVRLFAAENGKEIANVKQGAAIHDIAFSADGRWLATRNGDMRQATGGVMRIIDVSNGREVASAEHDGETRENMFSFNGQFLATFGSEEGVVRFYELAAGREIGLELDGKITKCAFSPDGRVLATAGEDGTARFINTDTGREISRIAHSGPLAHIAFSPDGRFLATLERDSGTVRMFEGVSDREVARFAPDETIRTFAFSRDSRKLVTGGAKGTVQLIELDTRHEIARVDHTASIRSVGSTLDGRLLAVSSDDGVLRFLETNTGKEFIRVEYLRPWFSDRDVRRLFTANYEGTGRLIDAASGREIARMDHGTYISAVNFSFDNRLLATGGQDGVVRLFDAENGEQVGKIEFGGSISSTPGAIDFSRDNRLIAAASENGIVGLIDRANAREIQRFTLDGPVSSVEFSPDGRFLVADSEKIPSFRPIESEGKTTRLFSVPEGREVLRLKNRLSEFIPGSGLGTEFSLSDGVYVAFSSDSRLLATASAGTLTVIDVASGKLVSRWVAPGGVIWRISFSPDAQWVSACIVPPSTKSSDLPLQDVRLIEVINGREMECAPWGGQDQAADLTVCRAW